MYLVCGALLPCSVLAVFQGPGEDDERRMNGGVVGGALGGGDVSRGRPKGANVSPVMGKRGEITKRLTYVYFPFVFCLAFLRRLFYFPRV